MLGNQKRNFVRLEMSVRPKKKQIKYGNVMMLSSLPWGKSQKLIMNAKEDLHTYSLVLLLPLLLPPFSD